MGSSCRSLLPCLLKANASSAQFGSDPFKQYRFPSRHSYMDQSTWNEDDRNLWDIHTSVFFSECRAYGRLKELGCEHLAGKVHGYVQLFASEKLDTLGRPWIIESLKRRFGKDADPSWYQWRTISKDLDRDPSNPEKYRTPVMGIVKDWIDNAIDFESSDVNYLRRALKENVAHLPRMLRDVHQLHKCGIVVRDLHAGQYVNGVLVDFSRAWTVPHFFGPERGAWPRWTFSSLAAGDLYTFQKRVIDEWNKQIHWFNETNTVHQSERLRKTRLRAYPTTPEKGALARLRPRAHRTEIQIPGGGPRRRLQHLENRFEGPIFPLLAGDLEVELPFVHWPKHDPAAFDWRGAGQKGAHRLQSTVRKENKPASSKPRRAKKEQSRKRSK